MQFSRKSTVVTRAPMSRRLRLEPLEDRRMLAIFTVDNLDDSGAGSLRQAIDDANAEAGADVVEFQAGLAGAILLSSAELTISDSLTIEGPGAASLVVVAPQDSRVFHVTVDSGPVTLAGMHLTGGNVVGSGGAILSETLSLLSINSSTISASSAMATVFEQGGGGISAAGDVVITGSTVSGNSVSGDLRNVGGGIRALGDITIERSTISGNSSIGSDSGFGAGGGVFAEGDVTVTHSTVSANTASAGGGGIFAEGNVTVTEGMIFGNSTTSESGAPGGGISAHGDVMITSSTISGNLASGGVSARGGGIESDGEVTIVSSTISGNSAIGDRAYIGKAYGGGISADFGALKLIDSTIIGNSVAASHAAEGGGVYARHGVEVTGGIVVGNSANAGSRAKGGGIHSNASLTIASSVVSGNTISDSSTGAGGAMYAQGDVTVTDSTILGNSLTARFDGYGGGVYARGRVMVASSTISANSLTTSEAAPASGGGIRSRGDVAITDSTISENSATAGEYGSPSGGGISSLGNVTTAGSTISGNSATASRAIALGGGIRAYGDVTITSGTVSGNSLIGDRAAYGGGIRAYGDATVADSTISGNTATAGMFGAPKGGGIHVVGELAVARSTISGNATSGGVFDGEFDPHGFPIGGYSPYRLPGGGGGIWVTGDPVTIENSIVAGNHTDDGATPDLRPGTGALSVRFSLIGDNSDTGLAPAPVGMPDAGGNMIGTAAAPIDPLLGPLGNNGGPTFTHALLTGSPAIDAGDPGFVPPPEFDQRGAPFVRVSDGRIDMGAFEKQAAMPGDGDGDFYVGDADYTVWANNFGLTGEDIPGDYNNDGILGPQDYTVWANNFGAGTPPSEASVSLRPVEPALQNVVAGLLTEPLAQCATGSASASVAVSAANLEQHQRPVELALRVANPRPVEPALRTAHAAHDAAIPELMAEGFGRHDPISRSSIDHIWALLNAGLFENDSAEMLIDVSKSGR